MRMKKWQKQIFSMTLLICFIVILSLSFIFVISHQHHDCIGMHCPTCEQIQSFQSLTQQMSVVCAVITWLWTVLSILRYIRFLFIQVRYHTATLIELEVQHNN